MPVALTNKDDVDFQSQSLTINANQTQFGLDSCATHNICTYKSLYTTLNVLNDDIDVRGVSESSITQEIGAVEFDLKDGDGKTHQIKLKDAIFLPEAPKNLELIFRWSKDGRDGCALIP